MNENFLAKYLKVCVTVEPILQSLPSSNIVESGFSNVYKLRSKERRILNIESSDLLLTTSLAIIIQKGLPGHLPNE